MCPTICQVCYLMWCEHFSCQSESYLLVINACLWYGAGVLNAGALTRQREAKSRKAVDERKEKRGDAVDRKPASQVNSSSLNSAVRICRCYCLSFI